MTTVLAAAPAATLPGRRRRWPWRRWARLAPLGPVVVLAIVGGWLAPYDPERVVGGPSLPPSGQFLLGTDPTGLDIFSRTLAATRLDIVIALLITVLASLAGIGAGVVVGMRESGGGSSGLAARGFTRLLEMISAVPSMIVAIAVVALFGSSEVAVILAVALVMTPSLTRLVRTEVLKVRGEAYLDTARMAGTREIALVLRHVVPNSAWPVLETVSVTFGQAVAITASLGFLGIGVPQPTPEWGSMIAIGTPDLAAGRWWSAAFPALALILTVIAVAVAAKGLFPTRGPAVTSETSSVPVGGAAVDVVKAGTVAEHVRGRS